jgi:membrane-bound metal-dependent hydrolase YbcI (DUF457 family)
MEIRINLSVNLWGCGLPLLIDSGNDAHLLEQIIAFAATGLSFGALPDILEPALRNQNHRDFFHSIVFGLLIYYLAKEAWRQFNKKDTSSKADEFDWSAFVCFLIIVALVAYMSHLFLDLLTKKGLPIV